MKIVSPGNIPDPPWRGTYQRFYCKAVFTSELEDDRDIIREQQQKVTAVGWNTRK